MKNALVSAIALVAFVPGIAAAEAPLANARPAAALRYADLDLRDPADAQVMLHRIRETASAVCSQGDAGAQAGALFQECYSKTIRQTVAKLNAPTVTAAYSPKTSTTLLAGR